MTETNEEHGRLIDGDTLLEDVNKRIDILRETQDWPKIYGAIIIRDMIQDALTVLEANK